ncbi:LLM class flavin-dependent oxidoreductase [Rhizorhabdus histidinilytica]
MKFSIIYEAQMVDTSRENEARVFHEIVEQALLAERLGFDTVWAVEHTALTQYAHMSAPETFLAYLAGRTTRLGIGHGVVCLPPAMNHRSRSPNGSRPSTYCRRGASISAWARAAPSRRRGPSAMSWPTCRR